jgi:hypothetical protein
MLLQHWLHKRHEIAATLPAPYAFIYIVPIASLCIRFIPMVKGKVSPVLNKWSTMPWRCRGESIYRSTFSWPRSLIEVSNQLHSLAALPPRKEPPVPLGYEAVWGPRTGLEDVEKRKFLTLEGLELRFCYIFRKRKFRLYRSKVVRHRGGPGSNPGLVMWDLWWTKWRWGSFSEYFGFPCQSSFHQFLHNHDHLSSGAGTIDQ